MLSFYFGLIPVPPPPYSLLALETILKYGKGHSIHTVSSSRRILRPHRNNHGHILNYLYSYNENWYISDLIREGIHMKV